MEPEIVKTKEEQIEEVFHKFGWTTDDKIFWSRYNTDPWVYNLANALLQSVVENTRLRAIIMAHTEGIINGVNETSDGGD